MKKIVTQNLFITLLSKLISFISFLYIAKIMTTADYGSYIYILMILSILPLFQFGSMHGTVILLPKYIADNNKDEAKLFDNYNLVSHLLQILSVLILFTINIELNLYILFAIAVNFILSKHIENTQMFLNANFNFEYANIIKAIDQILKPLLILIFFYIYQNIESIFTAQLIVTFFVFLISLFFKRFKLSLKNTSFIKSLKVIYRIGFFVYLVWAIDIIFRTADRWFISQFYSLGELAEYGFTSSLAMNVWLVAMSFFAPYAQLLYKNVAENKFKEVKHTVESTNNKLYILVTIISFCAILFYPFVLDLIVHKYFGTEWLFIILILSAILLSINNMYIYYMISNNLYFILLKYQIFILLINLVLNGFFAYYHLDIVYYSYSTIISLMIYFILVRRYFYIDIEKKIEQYK